MTEPEGINQQPQLEVKTDLFDFTGVPAQSIVEIYETIHSTEQYDHNLHSSLEDSFTDGLSIFLQDQETESVQAALEAIQQLSESENAKYRETAAIFADGVVAHDEEAGLALFRRMLVDPNDTVRQHAWEILNRAREDRVVGLVQTIGLIQHCIAHDQSAASTESAKSPE